jgi:pimeloyl-ACP methyl ester carboxylesterase
MKFLLNFLFYIYERKRIQFMRNELQFQNRIVSLGGHSIFFLEKKGDPQFPTLVLVHGFLDACYGFRKLAQHLHYPGRILIPDMPGYGRSSLPPVSYLYQLPVFADLLYRAFQALQLTDVTLCGHSMGGLVTQKIILKDQSTDSPFIRKAILLATGGIPHPKRDEMRRLLFPQTTQDISKLLGYLYHTNFPEPSWIAKKILLNQWNGWQNQYLAENTIRSEKEIFFGERAKGISIPVLIIGAEEDELATPEMMKKYKKWIRNSDLCILKDTRHAFHMEKPEQIAVLIRDFIRGS